MNSFNAYNDIRRCDFYLSKEEQKAWSDHESDPLYNTLWFEAFAAGPDIEYSETAVYAHSRLPFFQAKLRKGEWETVYHSKGKIIRPINDATFTADLMTGWWNPFEKIFRTKSRKIFVDGIRADGKENFEKWYNEFKKEKTEIFEKTELINALNNFLKVVYTVGNTIPAPINKFYGNNLDAWDAKLEVIKNSHDTDVTKKSTIAWYNHITSHYSGVSFEDKFNDFIKKNYLEMYLDERGNIKFFWTGKNGQHIPQTLDDWTAYFTNATERINERNKE